MPVYNPPPENLSQIYLDGQGILTQNIDRQAQASFTVMVTQRAYFMAVPLRAGQTVTNLHLVVAIAGTTSTAAYMGLYDTSGNRLGVTADLTTAWDTDDIKTHALGTPYVVTTSGLYYIAALSVSGAPPQVVRGSALATLASKVGSANPPTYIQSGISTLPNPATFSTAGGQISYWVGAS